MLKLMTIGERHRIIVAVLSSEQFRLQHLSKLEQQRQRRYQWWQTVSDL